MIQIYLIAERSLFIGTVRRDLGAKDNLANGGRQLEYEYESLILVKLFASFVYLPILHRFSCY